MSFSHRNALTFCTIYKLDTWSYNEAGDFTLEDCLLGAISLDKISD